MAAPVPHTCPNIDKVIKAIRSAYKAARSGEKVAERRSDAYYFFAEIQNDLYDIEDHLEKLRKDNAALREWGEGLEEDLQQAHKVYNELIAEEATT